MADFAPNFTARYKMRYSTLGHTHTMQWRIARGAGATGLANMILKVAAFLNSLTASRFTDWTILSATYAPEDSDVFLAAGTPAGVAAGTAAIPAQAVSESSASMGFVGRSIAGQKARMFMYGTLFSVEGIGTAGDNFRVTGAESGAAASAIAILNSSSPSIVASDGNNAVWYNYVNLKYNDYWVRKSR
jgi:hypothetical protein